MTMADLLVAVLGLGEAGGRICGGGMATVSLGRGEQRRSQHGGEEGEAARVQQRREEGEGVLLTTGREQGWLPRDHGRHGMAATIPPPPIARLGMRWRWAGPMLLDGPKCIRALEPINP